VKSVLVTGAAGFLGREVVKQLRMADCEVIPVDNLEPLCGSSSDCDSELMYADVTGAANWTWKPTHIIHLAAIGRNLTCEENPARAFQVNVDGTQQILEFGKQCGAETIVCSSNIVLSDQETTYRMTKRTAEELVRIYARNYPAMVLRPSNIAGRGQSRTEFQPCAFASMDKSFEENGFIAITGNGRQLRDFVNVKDVARAFLMALDKMVPGVCLDICTGNRVTLLNVMDFLGVSFKFVSERPGDAKDLVSDPKPAWDLLRFQSQITFPETIADSFPAVMRAQASRVNQQLQEGPGERS